MNIAKFVQDIAVEVRSGINDRRWLLNLVGTIP